MTNKSTDNVTTDVEDEQTADKTPLSVPETHRQWKIKAAGVLHDLATSKSLCSVFDRVMGDVGLPARQRILDDTYARTPEMISPDDVVGEDTPEAFEQWKRDTTVTLVEQANDHGISGVDDALLRAGFPARVRRAVVVKGEFSVTLPNVRFYEDDETDLIDLLNRYDVAEAVYQAINGNAGSDDNITWKATLAPVEDESE